MDTELSRAESVYNYNVLEPKKWSRWAVLFFTVLVAASTFYITYQDPCEDAHILFRVAENFRDYGEFSYNLGVHAEAATEFLWTIILAGAGMVLPIPAAAQYLGYGITLAMIAVLVWKRKPAYLLGLTPLVLWAHSGLGTTLFSALLMLFVIALDERRHLLAAVLSVLALLTRSEVLPLLVVLIVLYAPARKEYVVAFLAFALYWAWRTMYFHSFFPMTWTAKGAGNFSLYGMVATAIWLGCTFILPFIGDDDRAPRERFFAMLAIMLFPLGYLFSDQAMNIGLRFQFAYYPALIALFREDRPLISADRETWMQAVPAILLTVLIIPNLFSWVNFYDDRRMVGDRLRQLPHGVILTTEAGWLPYYSKWGTIDAVGLTDRYVMTYRDDTTMLYKYYDANKPDIIMWHCYEGSQAASIGSIARLHRPDSLAILRNLTGTFRTSVYSLYHYAMTRGYKMVCVTNSETDCRWWWVRVTDKRLMTALLTLDYPYCGMIEWTL